MNEYNIDIGNRIRELRELSDITIKEIAQELNITEETYIQYENAEIDIPASFLYELAHIFKVDLGLLLTGEESRMNIFDITRANKGVSVDRSKEYTHENLCTEAKSIPMKTYAPTSFTKRPKHSLWWSIPKRTLHLHLTHTPVRNSTMSLRVP